MKKCFLLLLTVFAIQTSYSQTEKGKKIIGGQISLSGYSDSELDTLTIYDRNTVRFSISPNFGYFIADNFAIGANINLEYSNSVQNQERTYPTTNLPSKYTYTLINSSYGLGGFARYYINITDNFKFYLNGSLDYAYLTTKRINSNNDPDYIYSTNNPESEKFQGSGISLSISPGLIYFVTPKIGIQAAYGNLNYSYSSIKNKDISYDNHINQSDYGIELNSSSFYLGLNYYF